MALPLFREDGWLPEGHYQTTWEEIVAVFGGEPGSHREYVLFRLLEWRDRARTKGMSGLLILNGSFISQKARPGDFDCIFIYDLPQDVSLEQDPEIKELTNYFRLKEQGYGDIFAFPTTTVRDYPQFCPLDVFDYDKMTKQPKGVVEVRL